MDKYIDNLDKELVCPYCMEEVSTDKIGCCGESNTHFEEAYIFNNRAYLESELDELLADIKLEGTI
jgi:hypothetical protein